MEATYFVKCLDTSDPRRVRPYFSEVREGYDFQACYEDIAEGQFSDIRAVYLAQDGKLFDVSAEICAALVANPRLWKSRDAREFLDYCGFDVEDAA